MASISNRSDYFVEEEQELLLHLIAGKDYATITECKRTDAMSISHKNAAWGKLMQKNRCHVNLSQKCSMEKALCGL